MRKRLLLLAVGLFWATFAYAGDLARLDATSHGFDAALEVTALKAVEIVLDIVRTGFLSPVNLERGLGFECLGPLPDQVLDQVQVLLLGVGEIGLCQVLEEHRRQLIAARDFLHLEYPYPYTQVFYSGV